MSRVNKRVAFKWVSIVTTALISIILLMLSWLYTTESGLQWLAARAQQFQPQALRLGQVSGSLSSQVKLTALDWQQEGLQIQAKGIVLNCQWLYLIDNLVSCAKVDVSSLSLSNVNDKKNPPRQTDLPKLSSVKLPIAVKAKQIKIARISYQQIMAQESTEKVVMGLELKNFALVRSKASVGTLTLTFDEHNVALSGYVDMRKKWAHQLSLNVSGPTLTTHIKSKGHISELAQLTLQMQSPLQATVSTDWFYRQGLFLKQGTLQASQQRLELAQQSIVVEQTKAKFELNWPKLTSTIQAKTTWQAFEQAQLALKAEIANVLDWQNSTALSVHLKNELKQAQLAALLQQVLPSVTDYSSVVITQPWSMLADLDMRISQGLFTLKSKAINLGELTASLQGQFNLNRPIAEGFSFKGQLNSGKLALDNVFHLTNAKANWQVKKQAEQWLISTQGSIAELVLAEFDAKDIAWGIDFSERWQAELKAKLLKANDVDIEQAIVTVAGVAGHHNVLFNANVAGNTPMKLNFDGQLLNQYAKPLALVSDLKHGSWQINNLEFSALNQHQALLLRAEQLQLSSEKQNLINLCLNGSGSLCINAKNHGGDWQANLAFEQWSMSAMAEQVKVWQAMLPALPEQFPQEVQGVVTGQLQLEGKKQQLKEFAANLSLPSFKWRSSDLNVSGQGFSLNSQQTQGVIEVVTQWQALQSNLSLAEFPSELSMPQGLLVVSITPDFIVDFDLSQTDISLSIWDEKGQNDMPELKRIITLELMKLQGKWQQEKITTQLNIRLPADDEITAQLTSDWPLMDSARLAGNLSLNLQQFDWLKQWQKRIDKIDLSLQQNFAIAGTWAEPLFDGEGALDINHLVIDQYGLDIRDSKVKLSSKQDSITLLGELKNPQGALTLSGKAKFSHPMTANITLEGQQVTLVNNADNKLIVSPTLNAHYQDRHLTVDGHLLVDQADVKLGSLPKPAITVSEDQVIMDETDSTRKDSPYSYHVALTIAAGDNVKISGFGLTSDIQGNLSSLLLSGQPLILNGRLDLKDGKFQAYKQTLTIEQGQLLFLGAAENPSIQFRAVRIVDDIKVGIIADGTIHQPRLTLFSEPAMADENVLALLITGRNLASLSQQEGNALTSAAISLGVESANKLVQKIGDQLGLKDVAFTSKSAHNGNSTRVDIAAKINDRLHVGYGTSIDSDNSVQAGWNIEYKLSPSISFEATSGEEISANINYKKQFSSTKDKDKDKDKDKE